MADSFSFKGLLFFIILNSYVESASAAGTNNSVLASLFRKSEIVSAGRTTLVNVSFSVAEFTLYKLELLLRLLNKFKESKVFSLSFVNVS